MASNKKITSKIIIFLSKIRFLLLYLFIVFFELNKLGIEIKNKIVINSSLDYSWFIDSIQRFQNGYILGKDFIFTYGPLFQIIYSFPTVFLNTSSYVTTALSPITSITIIFLLILLLVKLIEKSKNDQFLLSTYLLFFVGLISYSSFDLIKMLIPLVFAITWYKYLIKGKKILGVFLVPLLPTVFGAFSYDLFIYSLLIAAFFSIVKSIRRRKIYPSIPIFIILIYHLFFSILLSGNLNYILYSLDTIRNYSETLNSFWTFDRSNFLYIFPLILIALSYLLYKDYKFDNSLRVNLLILSLASFFLLYSGITRSDHGHIVRSIYPSIITLFITFFYFAKKRKQLIILILVLFLFIPYKVDYVLSFSGVKNVVSVLKTKPQFLDIYKFSDNYYLNNNEINKISSFIQRNKKDVFVYPYDNYLLNINNTTYNSFPLQFYQYSNSITEFKGVEKFNIKSPKFIIFMVDQKGALDLDNIPNLTRNSHFFKWLLTNYSLKEKNNKYLILEYDKNKKTNIKKLNECSLYDFELLSSIENLSYLFKKPIYFLNNFRLPKINKKNIYIFFDDFNNSNKLAELFETNTNFNNYYISNPNEKNIEIKKYSPFFKKTTIYKLNNKNSMIYCFN